MPLNQEQKLTCKVCGFGDGKWKERQSMNIPDSLPLCQFCKIDGWTDDPSEIQDAILKDPLLKNVIEHQSPYRNL